MKVCYELLRKKFEPSFKISSYIGSTNPKPNRWITTKQGDICGELKLFNKALSGKKAEFESNENEISSRSNLYSNYQGKFISESALSMIINKYL